MNNPNSPPPRRADIAQLQEFLENASEEELNAHNERDAQNYEMQFTAFAAAYAQDTCYLCGKSFKTISKSEPCVHWLLRRGKFKKNDLPLLFPRFGFTQFAAFTRWAANQEQILSGINDINAHRSERKVFEFTVRWKNVEWTFDCSTNDYQGHAGKHTDFPHYHLQMRLDGRPFIDFSDFHIPLSEEDLFRLDVTKALPDHFEATFGPAGLGMQFASEISPDEIIEETEVTQDLDRATYRMQTVITAKDGKLDGATLLRIVQQSQQTGETIASLARKHLGSDHSIGTFISPGDGMPEIAKRSERKRR